MKPPQTEGRQTPWTLSIAALLLVALSGCLGASGLGVTGTDAVNQATPTGETTGATEAPGTTADEPGSTTDGMTDGSTAGTLTTSSATATEESSTSTPGDDAGATTTAGTTAEGTTTEASTDAVVTTAGSSPTPSVSTPPPATETPLPPQGLVSDCAQPVVDDPPAKVVDCQLEDYPEPKADVQVVVANAGEESIERLRVTLLLFDRDGNEAERDVRFVDDLPAGERFGYVYETGTDYEELSGRYVVVVQVVE